LSNRHVKIARIPSVEGNALPFPCQQNVVVFRWQ